MHRDDVLVFGSAALVGLAVARVPGVVIALVVAGVVRTVRRRRALAVSPVMVEERFADAVGALAAAVRSGASLTQAVRYATTEAAPPVRDDLTRIVAQLDTGIALEQALRSWPDVRPSANVELVVGALELHRRSGGDLPAVLDQVVGAMSTPVGIACVLAGLLLELGAFAWIRKLLVVD